MRRRVFTISSALSLLLCVATVALWVRSYLRTDWLTFTRQDRPDRPDMFTDYHLTSSLGVVQFFTSGYVDNLGPHRKWEYMCKEAYHIGDFFWGYNGYGNGWSVALPQWALALTAAVL